MKKSIVILILTLCHTITYAQRTTIIPSSYIAGNASVAYDKTWLPFHNPASLGRIKTTGFSLLYENKYITKELSNKVANIWTTTPLVNIGGSFSHFGYAQYNEILASLSFAKEFGKRFSLGVDAIYYNVFVGENNTHRQTFTTQVGASVRLSETFSVACSAFNPIFSKIKSEYTQKTLPTLFSIGSQYKFRNSVKWLVQLDKEIASPMRWATGFEYSPVELFCVRIGGYGYNDFRPTIGLGINIDYVSINMSADYNSSLGFAMLGAVVFEFNK
ncbi:MAG: hypothetical protein CSA89_00280 [Bacteroidales bacterium]|nr:MAG: hypothetical protein CSA89_00280 [Bacteroidales bacterium]